MSKATKVRRTHQSLKKGKKAQYLDEVLRLYHEEGLSGLAISRLLPIHNSNIYRWLDEYDLKNKGTGTSMKALRNTEERVKPRRVTGIQAPQIAPTDPEHRQGEGTPSNEGSNELEIMRRKVKELEKELKAKEISLREAKLRADLYNEIINVAEQRYNVPIRKKAGTKQ